MSLTKEQADSLLERFSQSTPEIQRGITLRFVEMYCEQEVVVERLRRQLDDLTAAAVMHAAEILQEPAIRWRPAPRAGEPWPDQTFLAAVLDDGEWYYHVIPGSPDRAVALVLRGASFIAEINEPKEIA